MKIKIHYHLPHQLKNRHISVEKLPFRIGRSLSSDLELKDEAVSLHHATLIEDGDNIFLINHSATNPTHHKYGPIEKIKLEENQTFFIGSTEVTIELSKSSYDETREIDINHFHKNKQDTHLLQYLFKVQEIRYTVFGLFAVLAYYHFSYITSYLRPNYIKVWATFLTQTLIIIPLITLFLSGIGKVTTGQFRFLGLLSRIIFCHLAIIIILDFIEYFEFYLSSNWAIYLYDYTSAMIFGTIICYQIARMLIINRAKKYLLLSSALLSLFIVSSFLLISKLNSDYTEGSYNNPVLPLLFSASPEKYPYKSFQKDLDETSKSLQKEMQSE